MRQEEVHSHTWTLVSVRSAHARGKQIVIVHFGERKSGFCINAQQRSSENKFVRQALGNGFPRLDARLSRVKMRELREFWP